METIIQIQHLQKHFGNLKVLNDVDFDIHKGEVVTIIGSSGSGKSTMLRCVNLLERMDGGHVLYHGKDILSGQMDVNEYRSKVGMVFQSFNLFNNLTVLENCMLGQIRVLKKLRISQALNCQVDKRHVLRLLVPCVWIQKCYYLMNQQVH